MTSHFISNALIPRPDMQDSSNDPYSGTIAAPHSVQSGQTIMALAHKIPRGKTTKSKAAHEESLMHLPSASKNFHHGTESYHDGHTFSQCLLEPSEYNIQDDSSLGKRVDFLGSIAELPPETPLFPINQTGVIPVSEGLQLRMPGDSIEIPCDFPGFVAAPEEKPSAVEAVPAQVIKVKHRGKCKDVAWKFPKDQKNVAKALLTLLFKAVQGKVKELVPDSVVYEIMIQILEKYKKRAAETLNAIVHSKE